MALQTPHQTRMRTPRPERMAALAHAVSPLDTKTVPRTMSMTWPDLLPELHLRRLRHPWKGCVSYVGAALKVRNGSDGRQPEIFKGSRSFSRKIVKARAESARRLYLRFAFVRTRGT